MRSRRPSSSADDEDTDTAPPVDGGDCTVAQLLSIPPELIPKACDSETRNTTSGSSNVISASQLPLSAQTLGRPEKIKTESTEPLDSDKMEEAMNYRRPKTRSIWLCSITTLCVTLLSILAMVAIVRSFQTRQCDSKGCRMTYMSPAYAPLINFDTEHTRFASKYKTCLYREREYDSSSLDPKGVPVLFIPGNAGSYKQVRSIAKEAARQWSDISRARQAIGDTGMRKLDFFTVDFNEDITAFHGQTLLDQAEYLNDAVAYILSLYHDARKSTLDSDLPDPSSVIIVGHSMGGVVARTMLTMPNYQPNSVNTIITLSAPHARSPVSFDEQIISTYTHINDYWRKAYSAKWANNNPLWYTTLISIAGGGLDTVVPSDYASVASLLPETHGFTVFTSSIPNVWVGIDHLAILWCDQLMKVLVGSLLEVVDVKRAGQTKTRAERMRIFKKWFLTGMESNAEKMLPQSDPTTLLTLVDSSDSIIPQGERLVLRGLGSEGKPHAHLMPVPPTAGAGGTKFTFITDQTLEHGGDGKLEVLLCSVFPLQPGQTAQLFSMNMDLSGESTGRTRLACKNAAGDVIHLPASREGSQHPFEDVPPFSYVQYELDDISEHQFVAIIDKASKPTDGFAIAEFVDKSSEKMQANVSLGALLMDGLQVTLPAHRPLVQELYIPALHSSLLAWKLAIRPQGCQAKKQLFAPILRQYLSDPYESKYFVNAKDADISLHGSAPFMPPPLKPGARKGVSLQFWFDPSCNAPIDVTLKFDPWGSLGKLYMRYRTIFAAFPLLMVALVLRKQFKEYDIRGRFMSFNEGLDTMIVQTFPVVLAGFSILATYLAVVTTAPVSRVTSSTTRVGDDTTMKGDYVKHDLFLGLQDPFFWFLAPLFALLSLGAVLVVNYMTMIALHVFMGIYSLLSNLILSGRGDKKRAITAAFVASSPKRRVSTTLILLFCVAFVVPYQFAFMVACLVQLATCVRALRYAYDNSPSDRNSAQWNFYNYTHSLFILMLWIIPINLPVLVVWVHNLAVHWLTPFSSHHNLISIVPFVLLVETLTSGKMIPRVTSRLRLVTDLLLVFLATYAGIYGVTYAYRLHHIVNLVVAWLVAVHFSKVQLSVDGVLDLFNDDEDSGGSKQRPE